MSMELLTALSFISSIGLLLVLALLAPLYGKLFFSTHTREFVTPEEHAKLRQSFGLEEAEDKEELSQTVADVKSRVLPNDLFGQPQEDYNPLSTYNPVRPPSLEERKQVMLDKLEEARAKDTDH